MLSLALALLQCASALRTLPDCSSAPLKGNDVCDRSLDAQTRASRLIAQWTLQEKADNMVNTSPGVPRLGIPAYEWWNEALHGVGRSPGVEFVKDNQADYGHATSFPQPISIGAGFDDDLVHKMATVISTEGRAFFNGRRTGLDFWSPNINPFKDPRWGRGQETPGEDVLHIQRYVYNFVRGIQGENNTKAIADCKHFVGYDLENWDGIMRDSFDAQISAQDLAEYYLPTFKTCARDAQAGSVMCSYNAVNGVPACANPYFMQTILREHWGWEAANHWITSDCRAIEDIFDQHFYLETWPKVVAAAVNAGVDLDCDMAFFSDNVTENAFPLFLPDAVHEGLLDETSMDRALTRLYTSIIELGYFDGGVTEQEQGYESLSSKDVATPESYALARRAAHQGVVLLKNDDDFLPLAAHTKVAVVGPFSDRTQDETYKGNYFGFTSFIESPLQEALKSFNVVSDPAEADVVVFVGGIDNTIEAEGRDRQTITWPVRQLADIDHLSTLGKPIVVVQLGAGQVDDTSLLQNDSVKALLWGGYLSMFTGSAVVDVLSGRYSPAGRLPVTQYPSDYVNQVPMTDMSLRPSDSNPGRTYRWYEGGVIEFGHGLHYTTFEVALGGPQSLSIQDLVGAGSAEYVENNVIKFEVQVTNTGSVTSDYVTLLFSKAEVGPKPFPLKTLVSYARAFAVEPTKSQTLSLDITLESLARVDEQGRLILFPGTYSLFVDDSSVEFELTGDAYVLDELPADPASQTSFEFRVQLDS